MENNLIRADKAYDELTALRTALTPSKRDSLDDHWNRGTIKFDKENNNNWGIFAAMFDGKSNDIPVIRFKAEVGLSFPPAVEGQEEVCNCKLEERWMEEEAFGEVCLMYLLGHLDEEQLKSYLASLEPPDERDSIIQQLTEQLESAKKAEEEAVAKCGEFKQRYEAMRENYRKMLYTAQSATDALSNEVHTAIESDFGAEQEATVQS